MTAKEAALQPNTKLNGTELISTGLDEELEMTRSSPKHKWRFWAICPGLCLLSLLSTLDAIIISTALLTIVNDLQLDELYVWIINSYTLTSTVFQPLYGTAADMSGRKPLMITALVLFCVGSGICGGVTTTGTLVGGRAIQGLGVSGLSVLPSLIACDVIPLCKRQKFISIVYGAFAIGTFIGPAVGESKVDHIGWRWIFILNLPIAGAALVLVVLYLQVKHDHDGHILWTSKPFRFRGQWIAHHIGYLDSARLKLGGYDSSLELMAYNCSSCFRLSRIDKIHLVLRVSMMSTADNATTSLF